MSNLFAKSVPSPVGNLTLVADNDALVAVLWENDDPSRVQLKDFTWISTHPMLDKTQSQLSEYFSGKRKVFQIPIRISGTHFQLKVWEKLIQIPYGQTSTYGQLARSIFSPKASRAVGAANRLNPLSIIIPCHRIIGSNGTLTGFAGGLETKRYLLEFESNKLC